MKSKLKYILSIVLAVVLLYFSFREVRWTEFWAVLKSCKWCFVLLSIVFGVLAAYLRGARWGLMLRPISPSIKDIKCFNAVNISRLSDYVVPYSSAVVRAGVVINKDLRLDKSFGTVVLERTWDVFCLAFLIILLLLFRWDMFGDFFAEKIIAPLLTRFSAKVLWAVAAVLIAAVVLVLMNRRVRKFTRGILQGASTCLHMDRKGLFLIYTVLMWFMFLMMSQTIICALPEDFGLTIVDAIFIMLVGSVAGCVPVPGGFGAFHYMVAMALDSIYGIPFETGIVFATLSHESQAIMMLFAGALSYFLESRAPKNTNE